MKLEAYEILSEKITVSYEFISEGPKGRIRKIVEYSDLGSSNLYNLGLMDQDENSGAVSDDVTTNNGDAQKVLATVAITMHAFTYKYAHARVLVQGNTAARIRLYRINISKYLNEILKTFDVFGFRNDRWEDFGRNVSYDAFMFTKKNKFVL